MVILVPLIKWNSWVSNHSNHHGEWDNSTENRFSCDGIIAIGLNPNENPPENRNSTPKCLG